MVLLVLEIIRAAVTTVVELRRFELRRRMAGGDYLQSRIRKTANEPPKPSTYEAKPAIPSVAPRRPPPPKGPPKMAPPNRPSFLPQQGSLANGAPQLAAPSGALPVAPGPPRPPAPPMGLPALKLGSPGDGGLLPGRLDGRQTRLPLGASTPPLTPGHGTPHGAMTPPGCLTPHGMPPGASPARPPPLPVRSGRTPPGGVSPSGSVRSVTHSLSEGLKDRANKSANPPPLPPGARPLPRSGGSNPPSRPNSHRSSGSGPAPPKPPTPPPAGTRRAGSFTGP